MSWTPVVSGDTGAVAWANKVEAALGTGIPAQGPTYILYYNSTDARYEARNGLDGTIDYTHDTSASTVLNQVIGAITSDAVYTGNGLIFVKRGLYHVTAAILLYGRGITIRGESGGLQSGTVFYLDDNTNTNVFQVGANDADLARDMHFHDFCIYGNKANNATGGAGIYTYSDPNQEEGYVENVMVFNTKGAAFHIQAPYWTLYNTTADTCDGGGYQIDGDANDAYVVDGDAYSTQADGFMIQGLANHARLTDCRAYLNADEGFTISAERASLTQCKSNSNTGHGFEVTGGHNHKFTGCSADSNTGDGFNVEAEAYGTEFVAPYSRNNGGYGIYLGSDTTANLYHVTITGGYLQANYKHGLYLLGCRDSLFTSIEIVDSSKLAANTYDGIIMDSSGGNHCTYNVFHGLKIRDYVANLGRYGINEVDANQDYNRYSDLQVNGQTTAPFRFQGANNIYEARLMSEQVQINGATTIPVMTFATGAWLARATLQYATAIANDTNVTVGYARSGAADPDYYVTSATSGTGNQWATSARTLAQHAVTAGDTVTFTQDGSGGAGEYLRLIVEYVLTGV